MAEVASDTSTTARLVFMMLACFRGGLWWFWRIWEPVADEMDLLELQRIKGEYLGNSHALYIHPFRPLPLTETSAASAIKMSDYGAFIRIYFLTGSPHSALARKVRSTSVSLPDSVGFMFRFPSLGLRRLNTFEQRGRLKHDTHNCCAAAVYPVRHLGSVVPFCLPGSSDPE